MKSERQMETENMLLFFGDLFCLFVFAVVDCGIDSLRKFVVMLA